MVTKERAEPNTHSQQNKTSKYVENKRKNTNKFF